MFLYSSLKMWPLPWSVFSVDSILNISSATLPCGVLNSALVISSNVCSSSGTDIFIFLISSLFLSGTFHASIYVLNLVIIFLNILSTAIPAGLILLLTSLDVSGFVGVSTDCLFSSLLIIVYNAFVYMIVFGWMPHARNCVLLGPECILYSYKYSEVCSENDVRCLRTTSFFFLTSSLI